MMFKPPAFGEGQRIGLFGGSFNPAHYGHYMVALYALKRLELDWVWWLVSPQNPLKDPSETGDYADRLACTREVAKPRRAGAARLFAARARRPSGDALLGGADPDQHGAQAGDGDSARLVLHPHAAAARELDGDPAARQVTTRLSEALERRGRTL